MNINVLFFVCVALLSIICAVLSYRLHELQTKVGEIGSRYWRWKEDMDKNFRAYQNALNGLKDEYSCLHEEFEKIVTLKERQDLQQERFLNGINNILNYDYGTARKAAGEHGKDEA